MISNKNWLIVFVMSLCFSSLILFTIHFWIFHDFHHIAIYTLHDLAFLPIEVLLVTVFLHQMMERQSFKNKLNKMNMVIGVFFSEIGIPLLQFFAEHDPDFLQKQRYLTFLSTWDDKTFQNKIKTALDFPYQAQISCNDLTELRKILLKKEDFLVRILENPVLLEHESFTDLLQAVFHLAEELHHRGDCLNLPDSDIKHLSGDITRGYSRMVPTWLSYLKYLKKNYPYLFSLAVRTNPFSEQMDIIVRE